jgi:hypothetical protein
MHCRGYVHVTLGLLEGGRGRKFPVNGLLRIAAAIIGAAMPTARSKIGPPRALQLLSRSEER